MGNKKAFEYAGDRATVRWDGQLCIHIGECGRAAGELFINGRKPWCDPDQAPDDEVIDVVRRCPTGALSVEFADGTNPETAADENTVHVAYNGPLFVRGKLEIQGAPEDAAGLRYRAALCRCGKSGNKPYCDNSHEKAAFRDSGAVGETGAGAEESGGPLTITPSKNGPLLAAGQLKIFNGSGRLAWQGSKTALCRCGGSNNKPFCDGQHKKNGFRDD